MASMAQVTGFFRNQDFNATDRYAGGLNPEEKRHQAGGSLSGPIKKDKLFYFVNAEVTRRNFPLINKLSSPTFYDAGGNWIGKCGTPATDATVRGREDDLRPAISDCAARSQLRAGLCKARLPPHGT